MKLLRPRLWIRAALSAAAFASVSVAAADPVPAAQGKKLLFVKWVHLAPIFLSADNNAEKHLRSMGFILTEAEPADCLAKAPGQDIVIVSSTVEAHDVEAKFRDTPLPVVTWEANIYDDMRMTGQFQETDYGCDLKEDVTYLWMANAPHPIAAGVPNGWFQPYKSPSRIKKIDWGTPGPGATVIATLPGEPRKAALFCYERGALMDGDFVAPGRRVGIFLHSESFDQLNDTGLKLFDAAILWALAPPGRP